MFGKQRLQLSLSGERESLGTALRTGSLSNVNFPPKGNFSTVFRVSPVSAVSQNDQLRNNPYAKEEYFGVAYSAILQGQRKRQGGERLSLRST